MDKEIFMPPLKPKQFRRSQIFQIFALIALVTICSLWRKSHVDRQEPNVQLHPNSERLRPAKPMAQNTSAVAGQQAVSTAAVQPIPAIQSVAKKVEAPDFSKIEAFQQWTDRWSKASPAERAALTQEGIMLADARRAEFKALIITDPQRALAEAVPRVIRQDLPIIIQNLIEQPVSAKGELNVYFGKAAPGVQIAATDLVLRSFEADGVSYRPHFFGQLSGIISKKGLPLRGIVMDHDFAVAENAVRPLEVGERIETGTTVEQTCPVSGITSAAITEGETVTVAAPVVEIGKRIIRLCDGSHVTVLEDNFRTYIQASGPGGSGFFYDNFPGTGSRAIGNLRCLYIRATYPDQQISPITEERAYADMRDNARFYLENSYGKLTQTTTVTSLVTLPHTLDWYKTQLDGQNGLSLVHTDSQAAALALGYDASQFDCIIVRINDGPLLAGNSWGGGNRVWLTWDGMDVINHEVGHSLGLNHANFWNSLDGTPYGYGENAEYGNHFDAMGFGFGFSAHYNTVSKRVLGWLPENAIHYAKSNGTYRVYAYDQPTLEQGKRYGLHVAKDSVRQYNLEYHPARGGRLVDSAVVIYSGTGSNAGHLLDTTQGSPDGKNDGGIAVGRTYSDLEADMHFTVLGVNTTTPPSLDITFNRGPFPDNMPPIATLAASATTIAVGGSVTFTATASDANGDSLAYRWECTDGEFGPNGAAYTRVFSKAGLVTVMLTVSDMKGGKVQRSVIVSVGTHSHQTVSGSVTVGGLPLPGVYLSSGNTSCFSNTDGSYTLAGLNSGSQTLNAMLNGYTLTPAFTNPLTVVVGNNIANWTALGKTTVTLNKITDTVEGGAVGSFRLTRSGDTSAALTVLVSPVGGTAVKDTDFTFMPDYLSSNSFKSFTIPAGAATLDIAVAAVNDVIQEGAESISLQLTGGVGYLASANSAVIMTVVDNDSNLPLVSVTAPDPYAVEAPVGENGIFKFSRSGPTTTALNLTVVWSGTASNGVDYTALPTTITIPVGQSIVNLMLTPTDDAIIEKPEDVIATISPNGSVYLLDRAATSATATITDDDTPVVTVGVLDAMALESGLNSGVFLVTRSGSTNTALKVYYGVSGDALHGTDYAPLNGEVTIPAGVKNAPIVITPYDDDLAEPTETVTLALANFNDTYSIGTPSQGSLEIIDNNDSPVVSVRPGDVGREGGSNPTFIFHSIGSGSGAIALNYTLSGSATSGSDYTAPSGTISISANGSNETTLSIPLLDDALAESAEKVVVKITPSPNYRIYNDGTAEDVVLDNDSGGDRVMISTVDQTSSEAGRTVGTFYISRKVSLGSLNVNYAIAGTATNGVDYQSLSGSVVIPDGQLGMNLVMTPVDDAIAEGTETVTLMILPGMGYSPDRPSSATYEIADNEISPITVGFQQGSLATSEKLGALGEYRDIPVVLSAASANIIRVDYKSAGGNATGDDVDWAFIDTANSNTPIFNGTLTFLPGVISQNLRIRIKNDNVVENSETVVIQLRAPYNASLTSGGNQFNVNIFDDLVPSLVTEERWNDASVYTNNTWASKPANHIGYLASYTTAQEVADNYSRRLSGQLVAPSTGSYTFWIASDDASRLYVSTDSTAAKKIEVAKLNGWTGFQNWDSNPTQKSVEINLTAGQSYYIEVQHQEGDGGDHVSVAWQGPGFSRTPLSNPVPDSIPRTVRMLIAASVRSETDGTEPMLQVLLDRAAGSTPVTVSYSASGTAIQGRNYTLPAGTLTFAAGEQMKAIPLTLIADSTMELTKTIIITLSNPSGASLASPASHTIQLNDVVRPVVNTVTGTAFSTQAVNSIVATATASVSGGQTITGWSIISGNTGGVFSINASGQIMLVRPEALLNPETVQLNVRVQGSLGISGDGLVNIICNPGTLAVTEQRWSGSSAFSNQNWSGTPSYSGGLATMTTLQDIGDNYSRRLVSFLKPQTSGDYTFWIAGDDDCRLYLSSDINEVNKVLIARVDGWTMFQNWDSNSSQKSVTIPLLAGKFYWLEAQHKEGGGGDHVSVAWSGPGISRVEMPANVLFLTAAGLHFEGPAPSIPNTLPTISSLNNLVLAEDTTSGVIAFTVGDAETAAASLLVSVSSSNSSLIPNSGIVLSGSGANRTFTINPASNQHGSSSITLTVDDGTSRAVRTFLITVNALNDAPTISSLSNQTLPMATATSALPFTVNDVETAATALTLTISSSNLLLVPKANIIVAGSGMSRTVKAIAAANQVGSTTITLGINDGTVNTNTSFTVSVSGTPSQTWNQQYFGSVLSTNTAADLADPDGDGMNNLLEYALNGNPLQASQTPQPMVSRTASQLTLSLTRTVARNDITIIVQASDNIGNWSNLASSIRGATMTALTAGVTVAETGTGATLNVQVKESYPTNLPTKRFMRTLVTRP